MKKQTLLKFPCDFPIKIVGHNNEQLIHDVISIIQKHAPTFNTENIKKKTSKGDKYLSLTATIHTKSKKQLDSIYKELNQCKQVVMTL